MLWDQLHAIKIKGKTTNTKYTHWIHPAFFSFSLLSFSYPNFNLVVGSSMFENPKIWTAFHSNFYPMHSVSFLFSLLKFSALLHFPSPVMTEPTLLLLSFSSLFDRLRNPRINLSFLCSGFTRCSVPVWSLKWKRKEQKLWCAHVRWRRGIQILCVIAGMQFFLSYPSIQTTTAEIMTRKQIITKFKESTNGVNAAAFLQIFPSFLFFFLITNLQKSLLLLTLLPPYLFFLCWNCE